MSTDTTTTDRHAALGVMDRLTATTDTRSYGYGDPGYHVEAQIRLGGALIATADGPNVDMWRGTPLPGLTREATYRLARDIERLAERGITVWARRPEAGKVALYVLRDTDRPPTDWPETDLYARPPLPWPEALVRYYAHDLAGLLA